MMEYLKIIRENAYFKVCIINLIEAIEDVKELDGIKIKSYLIDVINGVEPNTHKEDANKIVDFLRKKITENKGDNNNE